MSKCPDCMNEWDGRMCASCGYQPGAPMVTPNALTPGTMLANRYVLGNALGVSRQSIAYAAWDQQMDQRVIVTEFYPAVIVKRMQGIVAPQRNQAQFQVAMGRYQAFDGQQMLPLVQAFFGNGTAYRVYAPADQPQLKKQADMLLDQPILFRNEMGQAQMTINALMIDPLPKERPYTRVGNPGGRKKKKVLAAILAMLLVLVASCVIVLPMIATPVEPVIANATATPLATVLVAQETEATAAPVEEPTQVIAEATAPAAVTDAPVVADTTDAPIMAETTDAPEEVITANAATAVPTVEATAAPVMTEAPTAAIATEAPAAEPTATAVPTLAPSVDSWYLKVNAQLWQVDKDGNATNPVADASGLALDTVTISGLAFYKDIYHLNQIRLRSETARTEFDLSDCDQDITLELPRGNYTLILGREEKLSEARSLSRAEEIPFSSLDGNVPYETISYGAKNFEELCLDWFNLFDKAQTWASTNATSVEKLTLSSAGFYAINDTYYSIGKDGMLNMLSVVDKDSFYLVGTEADSLADFKIPLYPVHVPAQELDRNIFVKAMLTNSALNDEGLDVLSQLLTADADATFYASQGKYELAILASDAFVTANGQPYAISREFTVDESGKLPMLNEDQMKAEIFRDCGLWAYQVGTNAPVICGGNLDQAELNYIFGELIEQDPTFALRNVSFASASIGGKPLAFKGAKIVRGDVVIPLAELMLPATAPVVDELAAEAPVVVQPMADTLADVLQIATVQGLKLTDGAYVFYPAAAEDVKIDLAVKGNTDVTLTADQQQAVQKLLLAKIAEKGVGYIADVKKELEGQFVYQLDDAQLKLAAAEVGTMDAATVSGQKKYKVTIDCAPQELNKTEKASFGIVYIGKDTISNPVELNFAADEELDKLEKIGLQSLAQWDGEKMTLALGPGVYRLYYTSVDDKTDVETTKYSDPFASGEEMKLALANRCEHHWEKQLVKAASCTGKGAWMQKCTLCGEKGQELIEIPATGHDMLDATCTKAATCKVCGAEDSSHFPALGHAPGKAATCTTNQRCTRCNIELNPALGHKDGAAPTCTTNQKCTRCSVELKPALGHNPGAEATCTSAQTCKRCNSTLKAALGHAPGKEATCTTAQTCTRCGDTLKVALGHAPGNGPTCTAAQKCTRCSTTLKDKLGHAPGAAATCTTAQTCTRCGTTLKDKLGHAPGNGPTCTAAQKCDRCGTTLKDKLGHAPGAAATCTTAQTCTRCSTTLKDKLGHAPGNGPTCTAAQKCDRCGTTLKDKLGHAPGAEATCTTAQTCTRCGTTLKDKLGHAPGDGPTCTAAQKCTRCGTTLKEQLGHAPGDGPTCTAAQKCTRCGATLKEALGHNIASAVKTVGATCESGGYTTYKCVRCDVTENRDKTPATGHSYGDWGNNTATCTAGGQETRKCSNCGDTQTRPTSALGHSYGGWTTISTATCQDRAKQEHACTRSGCNATEWQYFGSKVDHSYVNGECKWCGKNEPGRGNDGEGGWWH